MLRKKNITLNGHKADGSEKLNAGDRVCFFLAEETIEKFRGTASPVSTVRKEELISIPVLYEDSPVSYTHLERFSRVHP